MCLKFFQGGSELVDIKFEEVTVIKEEEEDPLSITCPALKPEKEVSCLCPLLHRFPRH